jgi:hypothetical protein
MRVPPAKHPFELARGTLSKGPKFQVGDVHGNYDTEPGIPRLGGRAKVSTRHDKDGRAATIVLVEHLRPMPTQSDDGIVVIEEQLTRVLRDHDFRNLGYLRIGVWLKEVKLGTNLAITCHRSEPWLPVVPLEREKQGVPRNLPRIELCPPSFQLFILRIKEGVIAPRVGPDGAIKKCVVGRQGTFGLKLVAFIFRVSIEFIDIRRRPDEVAVQASDPVAG